MQTLIKLKASRDTHMTRVTEDSPYVFLINLVSIISGDSLKNRAIGDNQQFREGSNAPLYFDLLFPHPPFQQKTSTWSIKPYLLEKPLGVFVWFKKGSDTSYFEFLLEKVLIYSFSDYTWSIDSSELRHG